MKKLLATIMAVVTLGTVCAFASCELLGIDGKEEDKTYETVAGTWLGECNNTVTSESYGMTNQQTDVWDNALTLNADQTYSYHLTVTDTIYGSLVYGKLDVTVTGTYTATAKEEGIYTIVLAEATVLTGKAQVVVDPVANRELQDITLNLETAKTLSVTAGEQTSSCAMTFLYAAKTFDLDTSKAKDSYESFVDDVLDDQLITMNIEAIRQANELGITGDY